MHFTAWKLLLKKRKEKKKVGVTSFFWLLSRKFITEMAAKKL